MFRASLGSQSIAVVVAVVAVSALTVFYLNYSKRKKNGEEKEMSGQLRHPIFQHTRSMPEKQFDHPADIRRDLPVDEEEVLLKDVKQISSGHEGIVAEMQFSGASVAYSATLTKDTPELSKADMVVPNVRDFLVMGESEGLSLPSPFKQSESDAPVYTRDRKMGEKHQEDGKQGTENDTNIPTLTIETEPCSVSFPAFDRQTGSDESGRSNDQVSVEDGQTNYNLCHRDNLRQDLYTFYEAPVADLYDVKAFSSSEPLRENGKPLLFKNFTASATKTFRSELLNHAESTERETALARASGGSVNGRMDTGKREEFPAKKEKEKFYRLRGMNSSPLHDLKRKQIDHPSHQFGAYNQLLRDGRLRDCIEVLEDMENKHLLDMNKVYHAGFFRVCKSQKAVEEAFRFTKLIQNPTLSTFNMLMSVCASSQDFKRAFQVLQLVQDAGLKVDCKLYTTLISTCAKSGKVDTMFKVFHEMVNAGVEPNVHTYGALIDGCAKAGQVAKAFGAYGIMRSKNVKPDRVVFNALITACGESGAVDRAFDVLAEMRAEVHPIDPDHVTVGALMKACAKAGQVDRAHEVYKMIDEYDIKGTPEVFTIAVNCCSQNGDWDFAYRIYEDMTRKGVSPDEMFLSALIDVAGHAGKLDAAFKILEAARVEGVHAGIVAFSSLMGACRNARDWQKALLLYEDIKEMNLKPTVSMMNALVTVLCELDQLQKAAEILLEMKRQGLSPNTITYSILLVASEKMDNLEAGQMFLSQAKEDGVAPNLVMRRCIIGMCLRRYQQGCTLGEPVFSLTPGRLQLDNKWTSLALMVYREAIVAGVAPTVEELSQVLGCLKLPRDVHLRERLIENLSVSMDASKGSNLCCLVDGFGEYDPRAFSLLEEAASLGIIPAVSFKQSPITVDLRDLQIYTAEVYLLAVLRGLKHRLAGGTKLPNLAILLPSEKKEIQTPKGKKTINLAGRIGQAIAALLRRLRLTYIGTESRGRIRINGVAVKKWFQPKLDSPFSGNPTDLSSFQRRLAKGISLQQRNIRTGNLSLE